MTSTFTQLAVLQCAIHKDTDIKVQLKCKGLELPGRRRYNRTTRQPAPMVHTSNNLLCNNCSNSSLVLTKNQVSEFDSNNDCCHRAGAGLRAESQGTFGCIAQDCWPPDRKGLATPHNMHRVCTL